MAPTPTSLLTAVDGLRLRGLLGGYRLVHEKISDLPGRIDQVGTVPSTDKGSSEAMAPSLSSSTFPLRCTCVLEVHEFVICSENPVLPC